MKPALRGPAVIIAGTVIAGSLALVTTTVVARELGAAASALFTAFWSAMYLAVAALSGVQQEITRASAPIRAGESRAPLRSFTIAGTLIVAAVVAVAGVLWSLAVLGGWDPVIGLALVIGAAGYVVVVVAAGVLSGLQRWPVVAFLTALDAGLRFAAVLGVLAFTHDLRALALAVALPFGLAIALAWPLVRRLVVGRAAWDVPLPRILRNAGLAVLGALGSAIVISGFATLLVASSAGVDRALVGAVAFGATVIRAPLVVVVISLQGVLIVRLRDDPRPFRTAGIVAAAVTAAGAVLAGAVAVLGDPLLAVVVGQEFRLGVVVLATLVGSSALIGVMCVGGATLLARGAQGQFAMSWLVAAAATVVIIFLPVAFDLRLTLALLVPPVIGMLLQVSMIIAIARAARQVRADG